MTEKKRTDWIDVAKFMAILAVLIDHTDGLLYQDERIAYFSYYSVSLFILLMGITSYWSLARNNESVFFKVKSGCWKIFRPYFTATLVYCFLQTKCLDLGFLVERLVHFDASLPFYYVLLYIQLLLVAPAIYYFLTYVACGKRKIVIEIAGFLVVLAVAGFNVNYSNILGVYGGGGILFGGTYMVLLYIGMLCGKYYPQKINNLVFSLVALGISLFMTITWWFFITKDKFHVDSLLPFGDGIQPPSISLVIYAILMGCTIFFLEKVLSIIGLKQPLALMAYLGRHTLYIFLYHRAFIDFFFPSFFARTGIAISNIWLLRALYFGAMFLGPLIIEKVLGIIHEAIILAYCRTSFDGRE